MYINIAKNPHASWQLEDLKRICAKEWEDEINECKQNYGIDLEDILLGAMSLIPKTHKNILN